MYLYVHKCTIYNIHVHVQINLRIKKWRYRDGKKVQRQNKVYMHSSKTEQASEVTMTPALAI